MVEDDVSTASSVIIMLVMRIKHTSQKKKYVETREKKKSEKRAN